MPESPSLRFIEHTADVGIDVQADTLADLFVTAAAGMFELVLGRSPAAVPPSVPLEARRVTLQADDAAGLLVAWLRELLFLHETTWLCPYHAEFTTLTESSLDAAVQFGPAAEPVREIKGVTWHQLSVHRRNHAWQARVIFDV